ncbi:hypothetical protein CQA53_07420 [Helicobacter didelphidarum]|uniref:Uncharacterized protein n=1 Tax=Helicobacter didelphidarum TaxID=2040648 RepID=A0A3D8IK00_9HELI|nr:hypothetical protein [Helicobacter didelphidarum]RDU64891.1 hypothetical protein CQA53_07420 [Helicobacter didelphidarum]
MPFKRKKIENTQTKVEGLPFYTPLKIALESRGIDSGTAGQTAWLFVSFLIAGITSLLVVPFLKLFHIRSYLFEGYDTPTKILCFLIIFHCLVVMFRLKYFIVNILFFIVAYICFIVLDLRNIYLLLCIGSVLFIVYLLIPIYSWRIKILDGALYFFYSVVGWYIIHPINPKFQNLIVF